MSGFGNALRVYRNPRMLAILAMGFASGLPLALTGQTLQAWLTESKISLTEIGLFALVGTAYSLKFLWAPVLDRVPLPLLTARLGQRRSWLIVIQLALAAAIVALGASDPASDRMRTALFAALVAFLSASQDIVIDAFRIELLEKEEQGAGAAATQWGYRLGMIASSAGALGLAAAMDWPRAYLVMAALVGIGLITALVTPEPARANTWAGLAWRERLQLSVVEPFAEFASRPRWVTLLVFVVLYRLGDALAGGLSNAFYIQLGFTKGEIASVAKVFGVIATMVGIAVGGALVAKQGVHRALVSAGIIHALSNFAFVVQAWVGHDVSVLALTIFVENVTGGLVSAAFVAYLSGLCHPAFTATQYALLSSLTATGRTILASSAGYFAQLFGWPLFFALTALAAVPGILLARSLGGYDTRREIAPPAAAPAAST
jgi:PAT family beta-lactamase induction signal transducer AmpG